MRDEAGAKTQSSHSRDGDRGSGRQRAMNLFFHIAGHDLRRMRWWALAWVAVLIVPIVVMLSAAPEMSAERPLPTTKEFNTAMIFVQVITGYVLVLVLMQADPAIGTRQFWVTRPIAWWRMYCAKFVAALAIVWGGAVAVGLPWWLYCGAGGADLVRQGAEYFLLAVGVIVPAMLLGALTDSLARAILWSFLFFALVPASFIPVGFGLAPEAGVESVMILRMLTMTLIVVLLAIGVTAGIFKTRRRVWAAGVAALAVAMPWIMAMTLPSATLRREPREKNPEKAAAIKVTFIEGWSWPADVTRRTKAEMARDQLRISFKADHFPSDLRLHGFAVQQSWQWPGTELRRDDLLSTIGRIELPGFKQPGEDLETQQHLLRTAERIRQFEARAKVRNSAFTPQQPVSGVPLQAFSLVPSSWAMRMATQPSTYQATLWLSLLRPEVLNEVPVSLGESRGGGSHRATVTKVNTSGAQAEIGLRQSRLGFWTRAVNREMSRGSVFSPRSIELYFLLNRSRGEYRPVSASREGSLFVHGVEISHITLTLTEGRVWRGKGWAEPEGWLEGASLAYVGFRLEAIFSREVKVDGFKTHRNAPE